MGRFAIQLAALAQAHVTALVRDASEHVQAFLDRKVAGKVVLHVD